MVVEFLRTYLPPVERLLPWLTNDIVAGSKFGLCKNWNDEDDNNKSYHPPDDEASKRNYHIVLYKNKQSNERFHNCDN